MVSKLVLLSFQRHQSIQLTFLVLPIASLKLILNKVGSSAGFN